MTPWIPKENDLIWHSDGFVFAVHKRWKNGNAITLSHDTMPGRYRLEDCRPLKFDDLSSSFEIRYSASTVKAIPQDNGLVELTDGKTTQHVRFTLERYQEKQIQDFASVFDGQVIL